MELCEDDWKLLKKRCLGRTELTAEEEKEFKEEILRLNDEDKEKLKAKLEQVKESKKQSEELKSREFNIEEVRLSEERITAMEMGSDDQTKLKQELLEAINITWSTVADLMKEVAQAGGPRIGIPVFYVQEKNAWYKKWTHNEAISPSPINPTLLKSCIISHRTFVDICKTLIIPADAKPVHLLLSMCMNLMQTSFLALEVHSSLLPKAIRNVHKQVSKTATDGRYNKLREDKLEAAKIAREIWEEQFSQGKPPLSHHQMAQYLKSKHETMINGLSVLAFAELPRKALLDTVKMVAKDMNRPDLISGMKKIEKK